MTKSSHLVVCAVLALCCLAGCQQSTDGTDNNGTTANPKVNYGTILTTWADEYHYSFLAYQLQGEGFVRDTATSTDYTFPISQKRLVQAVVYKKGTLTFASTNIPSLDTSTWSYGAILSGMAVDGSTQNFVVTNSPNFTGSMTVPVTSPLNQVEISSPSNHTTITKSGGMTLTWTQAGAGSQAVGIHVHSKYSGGAEIFVPTNDDGSYTFSSGDLSGIANGAVIIVIQRGNYVTGTSPDGKNYFAALFTQDEHQVIFQ